MHLFRRKIFTLSIANYFFQISISGDINSKYIQKGNLYLCRYLLSAIMSIYVILVLSGLFAGFLSGSIGFGGGMIMLPIITWYYGMEAAVPIAAVAQLLSNLSRVFMGLRQINFKSVLWFLLPAAPFTVLGAFGLAVIPKQPATVALSVSLIVFAVLKLCGKINLPHNRAVWAAGGGITGLINGMLGISGPLSSAVFLSMELLPVSYVASEATAAAAMHLIKIITYGKLALADSTTLWQGVIIGVAMMIGNYPALKAINKIDKKKYRKIVAFCLIAASAFLAVSVIIKN